MSEPLANLVHTPQSSSPHHLVIKLGELAEVIGARQNPPLHPVGDTLCQKKKLVDIGLK